MPAGLARLGGPHLELLLGMVVPMGVNASWAGAVRGLRIAWQGLPIAWMGLPIAWQGLDIARES